MDYARRLRVLADEVKENILVVMRVYFEKPRTTVGWKGLINDPDLDGSFKINKGLRKARKILLDINTLGMPVGCEFLDTISPQYTADLVAWGAIGARTTECQLHRELASGLSMPVGFKNGTHGDTQIAIDAVRSASHPHHFLGLTSQSLAAIVHTTGNPECHVILRGGSSGPNYYKKDVLALKEKLAAVGLQQRVIIDCSHGNSSKKHTNQPIVAADIGSQISGGEKAIVGIMIESNISEGRQDIKEGCTLEYGKSVTDACIGWETTVDVLRNLSESVRQRANC
jgi:3-deoxy-7-phosphoheptulonate synthase